MRSSQCKPVPFAYQRMHEFIRVQRQLLDEAFGLEQRYSVSYTGLSLILLRVDPAAWESAFPICDDQVQVPDIFGQTMTLTVWPMYPDAHSSEPVNPLSVSVH